MLSANFYLQYDGRVTFNFEDALKWWEPNPAVDLLNQKMWKLYGKTIHVNLKNSLSERIQEALDVFGSDKSKAHRYDVVYARIFEILGDVKSILEIGIGSQNLQIQSSMPSEYRTGGSLLAWQQIYPNAKIYGADIDEETLISEGSISSYYVDQLDRNSVENLARVIHLDFGAEIDLIIDDGLHAPSANLSTLDALFSLLSSQGIYIVEDIRPNFRGIWCGAIASGITPGHGQVFLLDGPSISEDSCVAIFSSEISHIEALKRIAL
jgi:hypothetical protein